jgi:hypothetical protein
MYCRSEGEIVRLEVLTAVSTKVTVSSVMNTPNLHVIAERAWDLTK